MTFDTLTGPPRLDRRTALQLAVASALVAPMGWAVPGGALMRKPIPVSGEPLPVIGLGTNNYSPTTDTERADRRAVIKRLSALGASVIDTAPAYRESERTLGELIGEIGNRSKIFLASKVTSAGGSREEGLAMLEESMRRLRTSTIDLMQVHNLVGTEVLLPLLRDWQQQRRIRYVGITTSRAAQYPEVARLMRSVPLDFVQLDYSIANRGAAEQLLPLAAERNIAVLVNLPFGGRRDGNLFARVRNVSLPPIAADIGATSWAQFFLKYVVSHPAVTCAIPGMTKIANLEDNLGAARGTLPDAAQRRTMELTWDALGA